MSILSADEYERSSKTKSKALAKKSLTRAAISTEKGLSDTEKDARVCVCVRSCVRHVSFSCMCVRACVCVLISA